MVRLKFNHEAGWIPIFESDSSEVELWSSSEARDASGLRGFRWFLQTKLTEVNFALDIPNLIHSESRASARLSSESAQYY